MFSYISDKRIAVVGNAASLLDQRHGAEIEAHDIVIRMNRGVPLRPECQGQRTDILAFSTMDTVQDVYQKFNAKYLIWMSPKLRDKASGDMLFYDLERWDRLAAHLGSRPSVGAMVLDLLSSLDPGAVDIYGYDFKRSLTFYDRKQHLGPHDFKAEEKLCQDFLRNDHWSIVSDL